MDVSGQLSGVQYRPAAKPEPHRACRHPRRSPKAGTDPGDTVQDREKTRRCLLLSPSHFPISAPHVRSAQCSYHGAMILHESTGSTLSEVLHGAESALPVTEGEHLRYEGSRGHPVVYFALPSSFWSTEAIVLLGCFAHRFGMHVCSWHILPMFLKLHPPSREALGLHQFLVDTATPEDQSYRNKVKSCVCHGGIHV